jgi:hypothetical protein
MYQREERNITKTTLKERGWSDALIEQLLPPPIVCRNPYYRKMNMYLWKEYDVLEAEKRPEFTAHLKRRSVHQKRAQAAVRTKNRKMQERLTDAIARIRVEEVDYAQVVNDAVDAKQNWYDMTGQYDRRVRGADQKTIERWTVNYIRHNLTTYDSFLYSAKGKTGISFAYPLYRRAVLEKIAEVYPWLYGECMRQMEYCAPISGTSLPDNYSMRVPDEKPAEEESVTAEAVSV